MSQELKLRIITGFLMACSLILIAWIGGIWFRLCMIMMGLCIYYEWLHITNSLFLSLGEKIMRFIVFSFVLYMIISGFFKLAACLLILYSFVDWMISRVKSRGFWHSLGIVYSGLPPIAFASLRGNGFEGFVIVFFILSVVWSTDVFAYFVGRAIGGAKIAPNISPGKTWSGSLGGLFFGVGIGVALLSWFYSNSLQSAWVLSMMISISCQLGDLFESYVKRCFGVKQSGWLFPGHGGVMDRFDGLIFSCLTISVISFLGDSKGYIGFF
ncbi:phosphatidate cytidylyltransferase [Candidatus Liberibacter solanacearum]|nr:phosphatidate cytidylyltransferase [Candidatus Liberibacter solanacearum]KQC49473.1 phosphatidate cytidylyltransferase [Candidatus Liberibacter solanacearum]